jgi:hypothetical protein
LPAVPVALTSHRDVILRYVVQIVAYDKDNNNAPYMQFMCMYLPDFIPELGPGSPANCRCDLLGAGSFGMGLRISYTKQNGREIRWFFSIVRLMFAISQLADPAQICYQTSGPRTRRLQGDIEGKSFFTLHRPHSNCEIVLSVSACRNHVGFIAYLQLAPHVQFCCQRQRLPTLPTDTFPPITQREKVMIPLFSS